MTLIMKYDLHKRSKSNPQQERSYREVWQVIGGCVPGDCVLVLKVVAAAVVEVGEHGRREERERAETRMEQRSLEQERGLEV